MERPIAIDLFCGAGGMSLGIEASGFKVESAVEIDPIHSAIHKFNFPDCNTICNDIRMINANEITSGKIIDLVVGGPPCQGFSHIGQRQLDDPRNILVFEYLRLIREIKPKYFIFENVPGLTTGNHRKFLDELIIEFNKIGYSVEEPKILNAVDFGAPQNRKRLIILGTKHGLPGLTYPKATHNHSPNYSLFNNNEIIGSRSVLKDFEEIDIFTGDDNGVDVDLLEYNGYRHSYSFIKSGIYEKCNNRTFYRQRVYNHIGSTHTEASICRFNSTECGKVEPISRYFKLHPDMPCNTLRAGTASDRGAYTAPRPIHYKYPRCISVREAARLHTFPDWFVFHQTIWHGFREIGNSVIPLFAKKLGDQVIKLLNIDLSSIDISTFHPSDMKLLQMNMHEACSYFNVAQLISSRRRIKNAF